MMTKNIISNLAKILTTGMRPAKGQGNVQNLIFLFHKIFLFYQHIEKQKRLIRFILQIFKLLTLFSIFSVQVAVQFNPRNYEDLLPRTKTHHCRVFFLRNFPESSEQFFEIDFEWLVEDSLAIWIMVFTVMNLRKGLVFTIEILLSEILSCC